MKAQGKTQQLRRRIDRHPGLVTATLSWAALVALTALMSGCWQKEGEAPSSQPGQSATKGGSKPGPASRVAKGGKSGGISVGAVTPGATTSTATPEKPKPKPDRCVTVTYRHKKLSSHSDGEACLRHKNVIALENIDEKTVYSKSVCVRVNGTPVTHRLVRDKKTQTAKVMIDAVAGPNAIVSVRYCNGKLKCSEDCTVPKDGFLDAIAGGIGGGEEDWGSFGEEDGKKAAGDTDKAISGELAQLKDAMEAADANSPIFDQWMKDDTQSACGKQIASK